MNEDFKTYILDAIKCIDYKNFDEARNYVHRAILERTDAPEPFNLLGILEEYKGNSLQACKYYRAAYALDPTYKAASNNLERITGMGYRKPLVDIDFGSITNEQQNDCRYYVEYDANNVGHIKKVKKDTKNFGGI